VGERQATAKSRRMLGEAKWKKRKRIIGTE
jgi:hypothetical protein